MDSRSNSTQKHERNDVERGDQAVPPKRTKQGLPSHRGACLVNEQDGAPKRRSPQYDYSFAVEIHDFAVSLYTLKPDHDQDAEELFKYAAHVMDPTLGKTIAPTMAGPGIYEKLLQTVKTKLECSKRKFATCSSSSPQDEGHIMCDAPKVLAGTALAALGEDFFQKEINGEDKAPLKFSRALALGKRINVADNVDYFYATCAYNMGLIQHRSGDMKSSMVLFEKALHFLDKEKDSSSTTRPCLPLMLAILSNIGERRFRASQRNEALQFLSRAISLGKDAIVVASSASIELRRCVEAVLLNKGRIHFAYGEVDEALYACQEAQILRRARKDEDPLAFAITLFNIGLIYQEKGNLGEALEHLQHFVRLTKDAAGEDRSAVVTALNVITLIECDMSKHDDGVELCHLTLQDETKRYGFVHPKVATVLNRIGHLHFRRDDFDMALEFFLEGLRVEKIVLGDTHPNLRVTLNNIGNTYQNMGKYTEAMLFYGDSLEKMEDTDNEGQPITARILYNMGAIYYKRAQRQEAMQCFQLSLTIRRTVLGQNNHDVADTLHNIGIIYLEDSKMEDALKSLSDSLATRQQATCDAPSDFVTTMFMIGWIRQSNGNIEEALDMYKQTLREMAKLGSFHPYLDKTLYGMGEIYQQRGDLHDALTLFQASHRVLRKFIDNPNVAALPSLLSPVRHFFPKENGDTSGDEIDEGSTLHSSAGAA